MNFKNFKGHLGTVCKHKYWVFYYSCKFGNPVRGFFHDFSKFSPVEFWEGVKYWQGTRSPIDACKEENGISLAWMHHKGHNPSHYEYWVDYLDDGGKPQPMPQKYAIEMICDFLGAGRAYMGKNFTYKAEYEWWENKLKNKPNIAMHEGVKDFVGVVLYNLSSMTAKVNRKQIKEWYRFFVK